MRLVLTLCLLLAFTVPVLAQTNETVPSSTTDPTTNSNTTSTTIADPTTVSSTTTPASTTTTTDNSAEVQNARERKDSLTQERIVASQNLGVARLASEQLAADLAALDTEVARQASLLETTRLRLGSALVQAAEAAQAVERAAEEQARLEAKVTDLAVAGFLTSSAREGLIFGVEDVNEAVRQDRMLRESNSGPSELLEQLRIVREDRAIAKQRLDEANAETLALEASLTQSLEELNAQKASQLVLQQEMDRRVAAWEAQIASLSDAVDEVTRFLQQNDPDLATRGNRPPPLPGDPSVEGFQWPYIGRVGSGYGYRIHPIYRTRRLHTGLDIGGTTGDPIVAAKDGVVIWQKRRGGYGNAIVIDHGEGISTLYAHMNDYEANLGDIVARGDVIGYVGSTGTSTSPHLHFEVRVDGNTVDPMPYLP